MDIKDCEQAKSGDCCYCKNMEYHKLKQKLEVILDICKANKCIDNNGYCPQIRNIQEIIEEGR